MDPSALLVASLPGFGRVISERRKVMVLDIHDAISRRPALLATPVTCLYTLGRHSRVLQEPALTVVMAVPQHVQPTRCSSTARLGRDKFVRSVGYFGGFWHC